MVIYGDKNIQRGPIIHFQTVFSLLYGVIDYKISGRLNRASAAEPVDWGLISNLSNQKPQKLQAHLSSLETLYTKLSASIQN